MLGRQDEHANARPLSIEWTTELDDRSSENQGLMAHVVEEGCANTFKVLLASLLWASMSDATERLSRALCPDHPHASSRREKLLGAGGFHRLD